jgi:small-conductance mechanosensitive channel
MQNLHRSSGLPAALQAGLIFVLLLFAPLRAHGMLLPRDTCSGYAVQQPGPTAAYSQPQTPGDPRATALPSDEKPSRLARTALLIFLGSFALGYLGTVAAVFTYVFVAGFLTSLVLAVIILKKERNRRSRRIARLILLLGAGLILLGVLFAAVVLRFFPNTP